MRRLGALDRARFDRMKREADRFAAARRAEEEPARTLAQALEVALADPARDDGAKVVRALAELRPDLRAALDRAQGRRRGTTRGRTR